MCAFGVTQQPQLLLTIDFPDSQEHYEVRPYATLELQLSPYYII